MVTVREVGTSGPANDAIGGVPTIFYIDFGKKGRGEIIRLFCEEAGIAYKDQQWSLEEFNNLDLEVRRKYSAMLSLPSVEIGGEYLTQTVPILRLWCYKLGKYNGKTSEEQYFVDLIAEIASDWRTRFVDSLLSIDDKGFNFIQNNTKPFEHHKAYFLPRFIAGLETHLSTSPYSGKGPYVLGEEVTYADIIIWQMYHDEREVGGKVNELLVSSAPKLKQLVDAVAARPNIKAYHGSDWYLS